VIKVERAKKGPPGDLLLYIGQAGILKEHDHLLFHFIIYSATGTKNENH
jgi:hypothetical protein